MPLTGFVHVKQNKFQLRAQNPISSVSVGAAAKNNKFWIWKTNIYFNYWHDQEKWNYEKTQICRTNLVCFLLIVSQKDM